MLTVWNTRFTSLDENAFVNVLLNISETLTSGLKTTATVVVDETEVRKTSATSPLMVTELLNMLGPAGSVDIVKAFVSDAARERKGAEIVVLYAKE